MSEHYIYRMPPQPTGDVQQQLSQLREFLQVTVKQLNQMDTSTAVAGGSAVPLNYGNEPVNNEGKAVELRNKIKNLKALILRTAYDIQIEMDKIVTNMNYNFVAKSDFGDYQETVQTTIVQTAKETVESYNYNEIIDSTASAAANNMAISVLNHIDGQIRRGFIEVGGETYFGIAIGEKLTFSAAEQTRDGLEYYEITSDNFGLYTAKGWYFFSGGVRVGYFSSETQMLHVGNIVVEDSAKFGPWSLVISGSGATSKMGIKYTG